MPILFAWRQFKYIAMALNNPIVNTLHAHARAGGYVIGVGVHICWYVGRYVGRYICLWTKKRFESYFSDQFTFSIIRGRTSH